METDFFGGLELKNKKRNRFLSLEEKIQIKNGLTKGTTFVEIGKALGRHHSSISYQIAANGGRNNYDPYEAEEKLKKSRTERAKKAAQGRIVCESKLSKRVKNIEMQLEILANQIRQLKEK